MTSNVINRAYVSAPILKTLLATQTTNDELASAIGTSKAHLQAILLGDRDTTVDRYQEFAAAAGMELSLVPKHLARSAFLESGFQAEKGDKRSDLEIDQWSKDLMVTLREHRIRNNATLDQVSEVLGNSMPSFTKFQKAEPTSNLPGIQTVQRYADMFNLVLVAVGQNSSFAGHAKADFARDVSYKTAIAQFQKPPRETTDHVLGELLTRIKGDPTAFSERYRKLAETAPLLRGLEHVETERPAVVRMPPKFAAAVKARMEAAARNGVEKVPYAEVIKPWGNPKSWAHFASRKTFDHFYASVASLGLRQTDKKVADATERFLRAKMDMPISKLMGFLSNSGIALACEARLANGKRISFAIQEPAELSMVIDKLLGDRPLAPILRETSLSKPSIESLIAHPEENRMSTVFRLFQHFGITVSAVSNGMVLKAEQKAEQKADEPNAKFGKVGFGTKF